jgi:hypothetical protein
MVIGSIPTSIQLLQAAIAGLVEDENPPLENIWATQNFTLYNGTGNFCIEGNSGTNTVGGTLDLWSWWSGSWYYVWRFVPDDNHEYFQIRRQTSATAALGNAIAPTGGAVTAGTLLTLAAPSSTAANQWWKPILQSNGRYILVNKADESLCIAAAATPANNVRIALAALTASNNTWRILGPDSTSAAPAVPLTKPIIKVGALADVTALVGATLSEINLPSRVSVTYKGNSRAVRNVTWNTAAFDSSVAGELVLTGTVALEGIEVNPDNMVARIRIIFEKPRVPITELRISAVATVSVKRGATVRFALLLNEGADDLDIIWSVSNPLYATVNNDNSITILNKTGTVILTATDPISELSNSIVLRIT